MPGTALAIAFSLAATLPAAIPAPDAMPPAQRVADTAANEILQGQSDLYQRMTVDVSVQGQGPFRFLVDTGSQRTVVSSALARDLGLTPGPQVRVIGMGGEGSAATAHLDTLGIGSRALSDLIVPLLESRHIGADGILGTDSLQGQRVLLDFTRDTIVIGDPQELGGNSGYDIVVRARRKSGRLIMTEGRIEGIDVSVVIDTGASGSVGNLALQRAMRKRAEGTATLATVTGDDLVADIGFARKLNIGNLAVSNILIAFADAHAFRELNLHKRPAIFLGMRELRLFKRIAIDFPSRRIRFDLLQ